MRILLPHSSETFNGPWSLWSILLLRPSDICLPAEMMYMSKINQFSAKKSVFICIDLILGLEYVYIRSDTQRAAIVYTFYCRKAQIWKTPS